VAWTEDGEEVLRILKSKNPDNLLNFGECRDYRGSLKTV